MSELRQVDANLLVILDAILTEQNLTRAGLRIDMTQPAVSRALTRLRRQFNDDLLVRSGRGFLLTAKGVSLQPIVRKAVVEVTRTLEVLPSFDPRTSTRTFLISASDYVLEEVTSRLLRLLTVEAPGVSVEFDSMPAGSTVSSATLLRRDVIISRTGSAVPGKRQRLFRDEFVCIVASDNPRLSNGSLTLDDVAAMQHVIGAFGENIATPASDMLAEAGITARPGIIVRGLLSVPFMVSRTAMMGLVPRRLAERYKEGLGLIIAETPMKPGALIESAHWHPANSMDPALQWLVATLRRTMETSSSGSEVPPPAESSA
ncbi:LysR family transcriptional regulator [Pseudarthrobacter oxydans]|uniref:LysR family transcriptional regulator n=1 Tax=Pseudarthrobacter oxydans TaxID=1671 RepID=UPI00380F76CA